MAQETNSTKIFWEVFWFVGNLTTHHYSLANFESIKKLTQGQDGGVRRCRVSISPWLGHLPAAGGGPWCPRWWEEPPSELPPHTACRILIHKPGVGLKLLRWELRVQTTGLTENLRPQGIFIRVRSHGIPHLSTKTQLYPTAYELQCWKPQAKQTVRQEHNPTH